MTFGLGTIRRTILFRIISFIILISFSLTFIIPTSYAQMSLLPTSEVGLQVFVPPMLKGIKVDLNKPFNFDFVLDTGNSRLEAEDQRLKAESNKLIKYFLASLAIPENDLWVNLNPKEPDRIVPQEFGQTEMGRDLLAQDYILKQITASLMDPEGEVGKVFWKKIYKQVYEKFGTTDVPVDTLNKVWIVPAKAVVYENPSDGLKQATAFVVEAKLKVLLEEEYASHLSSPNGSIGDSQVLKKNGFPTKDFGNDKQVMTASIIKEIIIPVLEQEVNESEHFSQLRQVYYSLILAKWYKETLKESLLNKKYSDQKKVTGVDISNKNEKEEIYHQYLETFRKGVVNYIKEEYDPTTKSIIPRKYFSGGGNFSKEAWKDNYTVVHDSAMISKKTLATIIGTIMLISGIYTPNSPLLAAGKDSNATIEGENKSNNEIINNINTGQLTEYINQNFGITGGVTESQIGRSIENSKEPEYQELIKRTYKALEQIDINKQVPILFLEGYDNPNMAFALQEFGIIMVAAESFKGLTQDEQIALLAPKIAHELVHIMFPNISTLAQEALAYEKTAEALELVNGDPGTITITENISRAFRSIVENPSEIIRALRAASVEHINYDDISMQGPEGIIKLYNMFNEARTEFKFNTGLIMKIDSEVSPKIIQPERLMEAAQFSEEALKGKLEQIYGSYFDESSFSFDISGYRSFQNLNDIEDELYYSSLSEEFMRRIIFEILLKINPDLPIIFSQDSAKKKDFDTTVEKYFNNNGEVNLEEVFHKGLEAGARVLYVQWPEFVEQTKNKNASVSYLNEIFSSIDIIDPQNVLKEDNDLVNAKRLEEALKQVSRFGYDRLLKLIYFLPEGSISQGKEYGTVSISADFSKDIPEYLKMGVAPGKDFEFTFFHELGHVLQFDLSSEAKDDWRNLVKKIDWDPNVPLDNVVFEVFANSFAGLMMKGEPYGLFYHGNYAIVKRKSSPEIVKITPEVVKQIYQFFVKNVFGKESNEILKEIKQLQKDGQSVPDQLKQDLRGELRNLGKEMLPEWMAGHEYEYKTRLTPNQNIAGFIDSTVLSEPKKFDQAMVSKALDPVIISPEEYRYIDFSKELSPQDSKSLSDRKVLVENVKLMTDKRSIQLTNDLIVVPTFFYGITDAQQDQPILATTSANPCFIVSVWDKENKIGFLAHLPYLSELEDFINFVLTKMQLKLSSERFIDKANLKVMLIGGHGISAEHKNILNEGFIKQGIADIEDVGNIKDFDKVYTAALDTRTGEIFNVLQPLSKMVFPEVLPKFSARVDEKFIRLPGSKTTMAADQAFLVDRAMISEEAIKADFSPIVEAYGYQGFKDLLEYIPDYSPIIKIRDNFGMDWLRNNWITLLRLCSEYRQEAKHVLTAEFSRWKFILLKERNILENLWRMYALSQKNMKPLEEDIDILVGLIADKRIENKEYSTFVLSEYLTKFMRHVDFVLSREALLRLAVITDKKIKESVFEKILLPMFFKDPSFFDEELVKACLVGVDQEKSKYFLYYNGKSSPELFPYQKNFKALMSTGRKEVLLVHNISDGLGDELIRTMILKQALLDFNPELHITLYTARPYLYENQINLDVKDIRSYVSSDTKFDMVVNYSDDLYPGNQQSQALFEADVEKFKNSNSKDIIYLKSGLQGNLYTFDFDEILMGGVQIKFPFNKELNVYSGIFRFCVEMGLPLRFGTGSFGNAMGINQNNNQEANDFYEHIKIVSKKRFVVAFSPFGGSSADKGYTLNGKQDEENAIPEHKKNDQASFIKAIEDMAYNKAAVIILSNDQSWGNLETIQKMIEPLTKDVKENIFIAPSPRENSTLQKYIIAKADFFISVEGFGEHIAQLMGKKYAILDMPESGKFDRWIPKGNDKFQGVINPEELGAYVAKLIKEKILDQAMAVKTSTMLLKTLFLVWFGLGVFSSPAYAQAGHFLQKPFIANANEQLMNMSAQDIDPQIIENYNKYFQLTQSDLLSWVLAVESPTEYQFQQILTLSEKIIDEIGKKKFSTREELLKFINLAIDPNLKGKNTAYLKDAFPKTPEENPQGTFDCDSRSIMVANILNQIGIPSQLVLLEGHMVLMFIDEFGQYKYFELIENKLRALTDEELVQAHPINDLKKFLAYALGNEALALSVDRKDEESLKQIEKAFNLDPENITNIRNYIYFMRFDESKAELKSQLSDLLIEILVEKFHQLKNGQQGIMLTNEEIKNPQEFVFDDASVQEALQNSYIRYLFDKSIDELNGQHKYSEAAKRYEMLLKNEYAIGEEGSTKLKACFSFFMLENIFQSKDFGEFLAKAKNLSDEMYLLSQNPEIRKDSADFGFYKMRDFYNISNAEILVAKIISGEIVITPDNVKEFVDKYDSDPYMGEIIRYGKRAVLPFAYIVPHDMLREWPGFQEFIDVIQGVATEDVIKQWKNIQSLQPQDYLEERLVNTIINVFEFKKEGPLLYKFIFAEPSDQDIDGPQKIDLLFLFQDRPNIYVQLRLLVKRLNEEMLKDDYSPEAKSAMKLICERIIKLLPKKADQAMVGESFENVSYDPESGQLPTVNGRMLQQMAQRNKKVFFDGKKVYRFYSITSFINHYIESFEIVAEKGFGPKVLERGTTKEGVAFFTVEHIDGENLEQIARRQGKLSDEQLEMLKIFFGKLIEENMYVHDFKPSQFVIGKNSRGQEGVWLVDSEFLVTSEGKLMISKWIKGSLDRSWPDNNHIVNMWEDDYEMNSIDDWPKPWALCDPNGELKKFLDEKIKKLSADKAKELEANALTLKQVWETTTPQFYRTKDQNYRFLVRMVDPSALEDDFNNIYNGQIVSASLINFDKKELFQSWGKVGLILDPLDQNVIYSHWNGSLINTGYATHGEDNRKRIVDSLRKLYGANLNPDELLQKSQSVNNNEVILEGVGTKVKGILFQPNVGIDFNLYFGRYIKNIIDFAQEHKLPIIIVSQSEEFNHADKVSKATEEFQSFIEPFIDWNSWEKTETGFQPQSSPGGIDFNPNKFEIEKKSAGDAIKFNWPTDQKALENIQINGLVPIILKITPIESLPMFLGMADSPTQTAKANQI